KISLIDERNEIAAVKDGVAQNDVGVLTDIFNSYKKSVAIEIAIRVMSPKIIIIDEIGTADEKNAILSGTNAGVKIIATTHAKTLKELTNKPEIDELIKLKVFEKIVFLEGANNPCKIKEVVNISDF
ncbi:MAG: stage III sporulation protein AA, partial [Oscillospiraceae bacterium]